MAGGEEDEKLEKTTESSPADELFLLIVDKWQVLNLEGHIHATWIQA